MRNQLTILLSFIFIACNGQSSKDTEIWEPVPKKVYSSSDSSAPDDAIVLFDGKDLSSGKLSGEVRKVNGKLMMMVQLLLFLMELEGFKL